MPRFCLHLGKFLPTKEKAVLFLIRLSFCGVVWRVKGLCYWWFIYVSFFLNGSRLKLFRVWSMKLSLRRDGLEDRMPGSQSKIHYISGLPYSSESLSQSFPVCCLPVTIISYNPALFIYLYINIYIHRLVYMHASFHPLTSHMHAVSILNIMKYSS